LILSMRESYRVLKKYRIPHAEPLFLSHIEDVKLLKFPCVLKADVEGVIHKSDGGLIAVNMKDVHQAREAYEKIVFQAKGRGILQGVVAFPYLEGTELYMGMKRDPQFGPVITFGLGGIFVEVMKDVSLRIAPLTRKDAFAMMREIKGFKIIEGSRGKDPINQDILADLILKTAKMCLKEKRIIELDFNPIMARKNNIKVADARIVVASENTASMTKQSTRIAIAQVSGIPLPPARSR
jgi:acyl-CoA synthetase (NDP forming)